MSGFSNEYAYWDHAMSQRNPDYVTLSHQMVALARQKVSNDSELLWRLSQATFGQTFKMDWVNNRAGIKAKTVEARHYAERAVKASPDSFGAHLWMSKCLGQLILLEENVFGSMSMFSQFRYHLNHAINVDPQNWRVLLLEAQAQVVIYENLKALKNADGQIPDTIGPLQPLSVVEQKLANCLSQNPNSHEAYFAQCCVLFMGGKFGDAAECARAGSNLDRLNNGEKYVGKQLEDWLPHLLQVAQGHQMEHAKAPQP